MENNINNIKNRKVENLMSSRLTKKSYIIYGLGVSYFMIDQIYNQWLSYYYLPPETEKKLGKRSIFMLAGGLPLGILTIM